MAGRHRAPVEHHLGRVVATGTLAAVATGNFVAVGAESAPVSADSGPITAETLQIAPIRAQPALRTASDVSTAATYTVRTGDYLSGIAPRLKESWQQLYRDNTAVIGPNPDLIFPGQVLTGRHTTPAAPPPPAPKPSAGRHALHADITNSFGPVKPQTQAAADHVVTDVPGAGAITLGGTRASAIDPHGHPAGLAVDYMVLGNRALGDAIVQYHVAHWDALRVSYVIYRQHILLSPGGAWQLMDDRGSPTANHYDHVHVTYH
jgi:LysM repeat protein